MSIDSDLPFLAIRLDRSALAAEIARLPAAAWQTSGAAELGGEAVLPLVSVGGTGNSDFAAAGQMLPTLWLDACPILRDILTRIGAPLSRCRLLRLAPRARQSTQGRYYWLRHHAWLMRVSESGGVVLRDGNRITDLSAGGAWRADLSGRHELENPSEQAALLLCAETPRAPGGEITVGSLRLAACHFSVLAPEELNRLADELLQTHSTLVLSGVEAGSGQVAAPAAVQAALRQVQQRWREAYRRFGQTPQGELAYRDILLDFGEQVAAPLRRARLAPDGRAGAVLELIQSQFAQAPEAPGKRLAGHFLMRRWRELPDPDGAPARFERPIFILSAPRAGSTWLFELLSRAAGLWTIAEESHAVIEGIPALHPAAHGYVSNHLAAAEATAEIVLALRQGFSRRLQDNEGRLYHALPAGERPQAVRFLEKTPKNALRVAFLNAAFPDALFVYLYREPRENISSLIEGWRSRKFIAYPDLPHWLRRHWSFLLVPDWQAYAQASVAEIAAYQWTIANQSIARDLRSLPASRYRTVNYADLLASPQQVAARISRFAGLTLPFDRLRVGENPAPAGPDAVSRMTLSAPAPDKWRRHASELSQLPPRLEALWQSITLL